MTAAILYRANPRADAFARELLAWALTYQAQGLPILPMALSRDGDKRALVKWKDLGTPSVEQVKTWWTAWPLAMIGMKTGAASGIDVLDVDRKNGVDGFATLAALDVTMPRDLVEVVTPSGGSHFYFRHEPGRKKAAGAYGPGLDIRTDGQLIVLPPSRPRFDGPDYYYAEGQTADCLGLPMGRLWL
jgi:Bifunctional DNA primase/polymerase, N-terminal